MNILLIIASLTTYIMTAFFLPATSFAFTFDRNVPSAVQVQMTADLAFIKSVKSDNQSDLHKQIFGAVSGDSYSQFFNSRVTAVGLNGCGDSNAVACVIPFYDPSKMWLTKNYIKFSHPQVARMMVVFHESRHTEVRNDNWPHANCPSPFLGTDHKPIRSIWTGADLADQPACDETPFGSYGSSMIMLKNISKYCSNCSDKVKMDASIYADDQFKRIIDQKAIQDIKDDLYRE
ncbi:MAG: hypothetical protein ABIQ95_10390 [Bdellovibrionia bacterium]